MRRAGGPARRARSAPPVSLARPASIRAPPAPVWAAPLWPCPTRPFARLQRRVWAVRQTANHSAEERAESNRPCAKSGFAVSRQARRSGNAAHLARAPSGQTGGRNRPKGHDVAPVGASRGAPARRPRSSLRLPLRGLRECGPLRGLNRLRLTAGSPMIAMLRIAVPEGYGGLPQIRAAS